MRASVTDSFSAAHLLALYEGKCANLHGHNYTVTVYWEGEPDDESCMVRDFNACKALLKNTLHKYDHALLLPTDIVDTAEEELEEWAKRFEMNIAYIRGIRTTTELIAQQILSEIITAKAVEIKEGEKTSIYVERS